MDEVKANLNAPAAASDVHTAETLLKTHQDLGDDIRAHQDESVDGCHPRLILNALYFMLLLTLKKKRTLISLYSSWMYRDLYHITCLTPLFL